MRSQERERLVAGLTEAGIGNGVYYSTPLHRQPVFEHLGYAEGSLPVTERCARECLALPMSPTLGEAAQREVVQTPSRPSLPPERRLRPMGLLNRHRLWQVAVDAVLVGVAWYATYEVGFQIERNPGWDAYWKQTILIVIAIKLVCLAAFGAYNKWWRYLSLPDIMALLRAIGIATIVLLIVLSIVKFPRGVIIHPRPRRASRSSCSARLRPAGRGLRDADQEGRDRRRASRPAPRASARPPSARWCSTSSSR